MKSYSDFIDRILREPKLLEKLTPSEPLDWELPRRIREADDLTLTNGRVIGDASMFALVRGGLFYAVDALDLAHRIFQDAAGDLGSYWHGMMHRRESDFDNARYWFRRSGTLPWFGALHRAASEASPDMARQSNWDPYLFTGQCEQARFGAEGITTQLAELQRLEFETLFDYCWRQSKVS